MLYFGRLNKVKDGKLEKTLDWLNTLSTVRRDEAIATFAYEGVSREVFVLFKGVDGSHYVVGLNEAADTPKSGDPSVQINQEHTAIRQECLEPISGKGEVLLDLSV
jgi:hypothetical protein